MPRRLDPQQFSFIERLAAARTTERGIEAQLGVELLRVDAIREDVVRIRVSRDRSFDDSSTGAVCADLSAVPAFDIEETKQTVAVSTARMSVKLHKDPFGIEVIRPDGTDIVRSLFDPSGKPLAYGTLDQQFMLTRSRGAKDSIFGLGEKTGAFERTGRDYVLWNTDVASPHATKEFTETRPRGDPAKDPSSTTFDPYYVSIPFFYRLDHRGAGAGFFVDNAYRARYEFSLHDRYSLCFEGGQYTEYIFAGPALAAILAAYTWLTGHMQPPPLWTLGHHQCRWYPYTSDTLMQLAEMYRSKRIPCDAVWLDIDHMEGYRVFSWNKNRFPHPEGTLSALEADGFRTVVIVDPGVKVEPGYGIYDEGLSDNHFCKTAQGHTYVGKVWPGETAFPDFTRESVREWWSQRVAKHVSANIAGIWNDMNEPATGEVDPRSMRFDNGQQPHERYHNPYALLMAQATVEGLRRARPDRRSFVLSRAGSAGIQRYAANWLGDNCSRWNHLWMSIPMSLGLGISGQPFVGADVGGFAEDCSGELLARWYQYAALTPFFRNHACRGTIDQYPWSFGEDVEVICLAAVRLRYRLLPYLYSTFMQSAQTGQPVQKPLIFAFQDDPRTRDIDDEYLLGDVLLVAPVYEAGVRRRAVYLPRGTWHSWHGGGSRRGPCTFQAAAPAEFIPLFARGGGIVPTWPTAPQSTLGYQPELIELQVFIPDEDGETVSTLHEDDGITLAFLENLCYRTEFVLRRKGRRMSIVATLSGRGYAEFRRSKFRMVFHGTVGPRVTLNDAVIPLLDNTLLFENRAEPFELEAFLPA